jgi:hypothetical protein
VNEEHNTKKSSGLDLWGEHQFRLGAGLERDDATTRDASGVHHTVDGAETSPGAGDHVAHFGLVAYVRACHQYLGSQRL